jgi:hypothetical protein
MLREYKSIEPRSEFIQFFPGYGFVEANDADLCQNAGVRAEIVQEGGKHIVNYNTAEKYAFISERFVDFVISSLDSAKDSRGL